MLQAVQLAFDARPLGLEEPPALVVHEPEPDFHRLVAHHGVRDARHIYQIARRGSLEYVAALRRLRIECGLQIRDGIQFSSRFEGGDRLEKEYKARRDAGLDHRRARR